MCPPPALSSNAAEIKRAPLPSRRRKDGLIRFAKDNTSQGGEDGILQAIYDCLGDGPRTVVDVGAWDGVHLSNTHSLLVPDTSPWRGFLIEADASKCEKLRALHERSAMFVWRPLSRARTTRGSSLPYWASTAARDVDLSTTPTAFTTARRDFWSRAARQRWQ